jgi:hypothetical protein
MQYQQADEHTERRLLYVLWFASVVPTLFLIADGLPYSRIDEGHVLLRSAHMLNEDTWDAGWYRYPTLLANLIAAIASLIEFIGFDITTPSNENLEYNLAGPTTLLVIGRIVVATCAIMIPILIYHTARTLSISRLAAFGGALVSAVLPALLSRSYFVITDTVGAFFVVATGFFIAKILTDDTQSRKWVILSGLCAGLAFTSKYPSGAIALSVGLAILLKNMPKWTVVVKAWLYAALAFFASIFASMPQIFIKTSDVLADIEAQAGPYKTKVSPITYFEQALGGHEIGILIFLAILVGLIWGVSKAKTRAYLACVVVFCAPVLAVALSSSYQPFRNLLPVFMLAMITLPILLDRLREMRFGPWLAIGFCILCIWSGASQSIYLMDRLLNTEDSRVEAANWLKKNTPQGQTIIASRNLYVSREQALLHADSLIQCPKDTIINCISNFNAPATLLLSQEDAETLKAYLDGENLIRQAEFGSKPAPKVKNFWAHDQVLVTIVTKTK